MNQKEMKKFLIKIDINEFIDYLKISGVLESIFIAKSKYKNLSDKQYDKIFDRDKEYEISFLEGTGEDIPLDVNHVTISTEQENFGLLFKKKRKKKNEKI